MKYFFYEIIIIDIMLKNFCYVQTKFDKINILYVVNINSNFADLIYVIVWVYTL